MLFFEKNLHDPVIRRLLQECRMHPFPTPGPPPWSFDTTMPTPHPSPPPLRVHSPRRRWWRGVIRAGSELAFATAYVSVSVLSVWLIGLLFDARRQEQQAPRTLVVPDRRLEYDNRRLTDELRKAKMALDGMERPTLNPDLIPPTEVPRVPRD